MIIFPPAGSVPQPYGKRMKFEEARFAALQKHPDCEYAEVSDGSKLLLVPILVVKLWRDKKSYIVLVQLEMERGRSPLVSIPPFGRGFSRHRGLPIR
jgi:hypothetical protein